MAKNEVGDFESEEDEKKWEKLSIKELDDIKDQILEHLGEISRKELVKLYEHISGEKYKPWEEEEE